MKIRIRKGYIAIYGNTLPVRLDKFLIGGNKEISASTWPPFIFFKDEGAEIPWIVNHELIHFRQVYETFYIGALLLDIGERIYARLFLGMSAFDAYRYSALEQEAYLNQNNPNYLKERKLFSVFKYFFNKRNFTWNKETGEIIYE